MEMTVAEQKQLIETLIERVKTEIKSRAYDMPSHWGGYEIRQYIADQFAFEAMCMTDGRYPRYRKDILTHNL
jgi:pyridoxine/pyridoxamine 5'-phosphate oxidase